jgi:peptide/nickel transport system permease protein
VYTLGWLPDNGGYADIWVDPAKWFSSLILPWLCLAFLFAALYARLTRSNVLETMGEDYIRTARAKGLDRRTIVIKHGLRAALTPIVTIFGIDIGTLIGSTIITEQVFNLRGLGSLSIQAIQTLDLPVMLGVTVVAAFALVIANFIVDLLYAVIDPRVTV